MVTVNPDDHQTTVWACERDRGIKSRARLWHVMQDAEGPDYVKSARWQGLFQDVSLHKVTTRLGQIVPARDVNSRRKIDADDFSTMLAGDVDMAPEATADIQDESIAKRFETQGVPEVTMQMISPLMDEIRTGWAEVQTLTCEAFESVGQQVARRWRGGQKFGVTCEKARIVWLKHGQQCATQETRHARDDRKHGAAPLTA
jgi:hypothetical protein